MATKDTKTTKSTKGGKGAKTPPASKPAPKGGKKSK